MSRQIILCLFYAIAHNVFSQMPIVGKVIQTDGVPVEYFTVNFLSDTVSLGSASFIGGEFSVVVSSRVTNVEVSAWGFESDRKIVDVSGDTLLFTLENRQYELDEVNVVANGRNLTVDGNNFTLTVEGTDLAVLADINDVMCRVPLLMVNEKNEISMFGKDNVVVYVNGRRINNKKELDNLNPQTVKNVKLIGSPDARYDADADAVISITTKDYKGTEIAVRNVVTKGRLMSNASSAMLNMRLGTTDIHADYKFSVLRNRSYEVNSIFDIKDRVEYNNDEKSEGKSCGHSYSIAGEHAFGSGQKLSVQFVGWNDCGRPETDAFQQYYGLKDSSIVVTQKKIKDKENHYDVGIGYEFKFGQQSEVLVLANYTNQRVETISNVVENKLQHNYDFGSTYCAFDAQVDYQTSVFSGLNFDAGVKLSVVLNESASEFCSVSKALESVFSFKYDFAERIAGAYFDVGKTIGDLDFNAGLRAEFTYFEGHYNKGKVVDTT